MAFNSYSFILLFLPVFLILYFVFCKFGYSFSKGIIISAGIVFYLFAGLKSAAVLCVSITMNLCLTILILKAANTRLKRFLLIGAIILNVLLLMFYKYLNFFADIADPENKTIAARDLMLPVGISFFTFQQIMYVVSVWKGEINRIDISDYLSYILFFPKIIMGPLMEPVDFIKQVNDQGKKKIDARNIAGGLKLFSIGLFSKMVLADTFAKAVNWGFTNDISKTTSAELFLIMLFFTFQIYFDFNGYSNMAMGVSKMINIELPANFDSPYKALSIRSFWNRWHISLTNFLTKYIYIPLGGNRKGVIRTSVNIMIVYLISGIWHGANRTFLLWGCIHGLLQIIERLFEKKLCKLPAVIRWIGTFFAVNILWLLFRAERIDQWRKMLTQMFRFRDMSVSKDLIGLFVLPEQALIFDKLGLNQLNKSIRGFSMAIFIAGAFIICLIPESAYKKCGKLNWANMILCAVLFVWGFLCLSTESIFLYFNF